MKLLKRKINLKSVSSLMNFITLKTKKVVCLIMCIAIILSTPNFSVFAEMIEHETIEL